MLSGLCVLIIVARLEHVTLSLTVHNLLLYPILFSALSAYQRYFSLQLDYWKVSLLDASCLV